MKNPLQNLLIFFSICLCALCLFQWHREAALREQSQKLTDKGQDQLEAIRGLQGGLKRADEDIKRLEGLKAELTETVTSNRTQIATLMKAVEKSDLEVENGLKQIEVYKSALQTANDAIKKQNEDVKKQNEELKTLAAERNDAVTKYNKVVQEFNELAQKWNDAQAAAAAAATNAPPKK